MTLNLAVLLEESAKAHADKPALLLGEHRMAYAELRGAAKKFAGALEALGVEPGEKVAMMVPNVPQFAVAYYGILNRGAVVVPLNVLLKEDEIAYHLEDSDARALVVWEGFLEEAHKGFEKAAGCRELIVVEAPGGNGARDGMRGFAALLSEHPPEYELYQPMPDDTAVILYTSGTTGRPKGAELTHFNLFYNASYSADRLMDVTEDDVVIGALPLFHVFGQTCVMNTMLYKGGTIALIPRFEPDAALKTIQDARVTIFMGVPTMYQYLMRHPELESFDTSSLRLGISGGSAMPVEVLRAFEEKFGVTILEGYGLSETSPVASFNRSAEVRKAGSIGLPIWGTEVRVVDGNDREVPRGERGELVIRGHNVMKGYYKRPEATAEAMRNGWFHTGDVATQDEDGFLYIVDRVKDMILRGGYNIYPREVEEVLYQHPAVAECAVIGVPHEELGEEVRAVVALKPGESATEEEIISFVKDRVAAYKYPRSVVFMDELPKTATGKILKRELVPNREETKA
ncbi:long-chain fatty acid--CoA ligase [Rubrobacter taiwanensis]|jgi:long-chain acyl-CoA synthetase|uniref:Long-chain fatty acid--CoA ligase n=1 Tax=Rubrobacter taiwanensis TaxID=185139 RepID=A0A4R1BCP1_9ACTN|nr:long-chain fatty acid--CoA ligase [Rubrobacter taiwanensis]TCJ14825.1 long-chain fatty acid--CoA ligase [Rubrobacter taiwanensis]